MSCSLALIAELHETFAGQFMQPSIEPATWFEVETTDGTEIVPSDLFDSAELTIRALRLSPYVLGRILSPDERLEKCSGWLARLLAPGYMDCTDWTGHASADAAARYLIDTYGDES